MRATSILLAVVAGAAFCATSFAAPLIVEKNLFAQERKPLPPETAASTPQPKGPGLSHNQIQLDGVIIHGSSKKAIVRMKNPPPSPDKKKQQSPFLAVREGQQIGDYKVVKIENKSISLEKDGQTVVISLFAEGKVASPPPPMPVTPQPATAGGGQPPVPGQPPVAGMAGVRGQIPPGQGAPPQPGIQQGQPQPAPEVEDSGQPEDQVPDVIEEEIE
jgi:hypothetical protein